MALEKNNELLESQPTLSRANGLSLTYKVFLLLLLSLASPMGNFSEIKWASKNTYGGAINSAEARNELILYAVKNALSKVENINDFPIEIKYDRLTKEVADKANLPTSLNIDPKEIQTPANHVEINIGQLKYQIEPRNWVGKVHKLEFKNHILYTKIGYVTYTWTIDEIGKYCITLINAKWEDISFFWARASNLKNLASKIK